VSRLSGVVVAVVLCAALVASAAGATARDSRAWKPHAGLAKSWAEHRRGVIAFSVRTPTREWAWHGGRVYPTASVLKPMLMLAYLQRPNVRDRPLNASDRALLRPMITRSDNAAASAVLGIVGTGGLYRVARRARMRSFRAVTPIWGNSQTTADDQSRFFLRIERLLPPRHRAYAMHLLASIVPSQRWGIGQVRLPGWRVYFKGGWGSGTGRVDHQVILLARGRQRVALAIMTMADGTHAYGKATLRGLARLLLRGLPRRGVVP
jgi:hypothetical protein